MNPFRNRRLLPQSVLMLLMIVATATNAAAKDSQPGTKRKQAAKPQPNAAACTFGEPVRTVWEFGLQINVVDQAKGVTATVPVPIDWPEQSVTVLKDEKSKQVGRFRYRQPTKETRQLEFNVNRLQAATPAVAYQQFEVLRRPILKPADPQTLEIASPVPGAAKQFLKRSPYIESTDRRIKAIAKELKAEHADGSAWDWVEAIYRDVRERLEYEFDPQIHSCLDALDAGKGDCEELSSLFIAICRASGIPARAVWIPGHTYPEFFLVDAQGNGHWFPCQVAGVYEFGEMNETRPVLQKGDRFRLPGQRKAVRYLQPTLLAKDPGAGITMEWISRDVTDGENSPNKPNDERDREPSEPLSELTR